MRWPHISRTIIAALAFLLLPSCTAPQGAWQPSAGHPGDPDAPSSALSEPSATLALTDDEMPGSPAESDAGAHSEHAHNGDNDGMHGEDTGPAPVMSPEPYLCPMHPEVGAPEASARCPKCGMRLVPRAEVEDQ
jgi:hypothetical protein